MIVAITHGSCLVVDADDCTRLHTTADGLDDAEAGAALTRAELGVAGEPDQVWLAIDALRASARVSATNGDWDARFDAMIAFARSKGWLDATGQHVAAHIERSGAMNVERSGAMNIERSEP